MAFESPFVEFRALTVLSLMFCKFGVNAIGGGGGGGAGGIDMGGGGGGGGGGGAQESDGGDTQEDCTAILASFNFFLSSSTKSDGNSTVL